MAELVNLNKARKAKARTIARDQADQNSVKFGRTRAEKTLDAARNDKARRDLDGHARDPE